MIEFIERSSEVFLFLVLLALFYQKKFALKIKITKFMFHLKR